MAIKSTIDQTSIMATTGIGTIMMATQRGIIADVITIADMTTTSFIITGARDIDTMTTATINIITVITGITIVAMTMLING